MKSDIESLRFGNINPDPEAFSVETDIGRTTVEEVGPERQKPQEYGIGSVADLCDESSS